MAAKQANVVARIKQIQSEGVEAIARGNIAPFEGFTPEFLGDQCGVFARYTAQSESTCLSMLRPLVENIEQESNSELFMVGRDFRLHTTVMNATGPKEAFETFKQKVVPSLPTLEGLEVEFTRLIADKSVIILCAEYVPDEVRNMREILWEEFAECGLKPKAIADIFHCTISRMMKVGNKLDVYRDRVHIGDTTFSESPIVLKIEHARFSPAMDLFTM
ncbi:MAG TPA: hypothetical protein PLF31_01275 [Candidatus Paceibacterota bacterium]|nr:hypothetical protein [Candidatus Paceibacterota bacterium]